MTLATRDLAFAYRPGAPVLDAVSMEVPAGRVTAIFGPNGCGKSTLVRCLNGILRPSAGVALLDGALVSSMPRDAVARRIAVVPQDVPADVEMTVAEVVALGRFAWATGQTADRQAVHEALRRTGLTDRALVPFASLSGGERRRALIARAVAQDPAFVLMDEPDANLDLEHRVGMYDLARSLAAEGRGVLLVCHDLFLAPLHADEAVLMRAGRILAAGAPEDVLTPGGLRGAFGDAVTLRWDDGRRVTAELRDSCGSSGVPPDP